MDGYLLRELALHLRQEAYRTGVALGRLSVQGGDGLALHREVGGMLGTACEVLRGLGVFQFALKDRKLADYLRPLAHGPLFDLRLLRLLSPFPRFFLGGGVPFPAWAQVLRVGLRVRVRHLNASRRRSIRTAVRGNRGRSCGPRMRIRPGSTSCTACSMPSGSFPLCSCAPPSIYLRGRPAYRGRGHLGQDRVPSADDPGAGRA